MLGARDGVRGNEERGNATECGARGPKHGLFDAPSIGERRVGAESGAKRPEYVLHRSHRGAYHDHVRPAHGLDRIEEEAVDDPEILRAAKVRFAPARPHHLSDRASATQGAGEGPADESDPYDAQTLDHAADPGSGSASITRKERMPGVAGRTSDESSHARNRVSWGS